MFKGKGCNIIICADVASRGLDIQGVNVVINYDIPMNSKDYVHRVGRTARAGQSGFAASLVNQYEAQWFVQIEQLFGKLGWNDNDLFVGTERDIDVVSNDINDSSISAYCVTESPSLFITVPVKNYF